MIDLRSTSKSHWTMATFSKRHPMIEIGSLDSFSLDENLRRGIPDAPVKPPDFYFEPPRSAKSHFLLVSSAEDERPDPDQVILVTKLYSHMVSMVHGRKVFAADSKRIYLQP